MTDTQKDYNKMSDSEKKKEDWMNSKWRPMMGWMYMLVCMFDFMLAPVLWSLLQAVYKGGISTQWQPLTLQGAGLFHIAMGAILGIAAYGRTQEKLNGANNGGLQSPSIPTPTSSPIVPSVPSSPIVATTTSVSETVTSTPVPVVPTLKPLGPFMNMPER